MRRLCFLVVPLLLFALLPAAAPRSAAALDLRTPSAEVTVTNPGDDYLTLQQIKDGGYCTQPSIPDCTVRSATTFAVYMGSGVYIPPGTYVLSNGSLVIDQPDKGLNLSYRGDGMDQATLIGGAGRLLTVNARPDSSQLTLTGLTLQGGSTGGAGGAIQSNVPTTLDRVRLRENHSNSSGGGIAILLGGSLTIANSEVISNTASWGGGISTTESTTPLNMSNTLVAYNVAGYAAGGLDIVGTGTIDLSVIRNNRSYAEAGGLRGLASIEVTNSLITGNRSSNHGGGGALGNSSAPPGQTMTAHFENVTISDNHDSNGMGGGLSVWANATVVLDDSTVSGNSAYRYGGGVYTEAIVELHNTSVISNSAPTGAGVMLNSTIYHVNRLSLTNSVIAYNVSSAGLGDCAGALQANVYNYIQKVVGGICSAAGVMTGGDPQLGPLQDNGGLTPTHLPDANSLLVNAGDPNGCFGLGVLTLDQRGQPRPSGGGRCDLGAVEVQSCVTPGAPSDVMGQPSGNNLVLKWTAAGADLYEVWWSTDQPFFSPGASCAASPGSCATTTVPGYTHVNALVGSPPPWYSYVLVGRNSCGAAAGSYSNRSGVFSFGVTPGG